MAGLRPTKAFAGATLDIATIPVGSPFYRIYHEHYPDPLGFGKSRSRFSDPSRRLVDRRFGVVYLGSTLKVCFVEAVLRDQRNGQVGDYPIEEVELIRRQLAEITVTDPLSLVDLRGDGPIRMGIPSDVVGAAKQGLARTWSLAFHRHPTAPDGIIYPSRLNEEINLAVYDRAIRKLKVSWSVKLIDAPALPNVLNDLKVALV